MYRWGLNGEKIKYSGHIYAVEYDDGLVKIGCTTWFERRLWELDNNYRPKHRIIKTHCSCWVSDMFEVEKKILGMLKPVEKREVFNIPFEQAVIMINIITLMSSVAEDLQKAYTEYMTNKKIYDGLEEALQRKAWLDETLYENVVKTMI